MGWRGGVSLENKVGEGREGDGRLEEGRSWGKVRGRGRSIKEGKQEGWREEKGRKKTKWDVAGKEVSSSVPVARDSFAINDL